MFVAGCDEGQNRADGECFSRYSKWLLMVNQLHFGRKCKELPLTCLGLVLTHFTHQEETAMVKFLTPPLTQTFSLCFTHQQCGLTPCCVGEFFEDVSLVLSKMHCFIPVCVYVRERDRGFVVEGSRV